MNGPKVQVVIPMKALALAKQRLAPALAPANRRALVVAMLQDVLAAVEGSGLADGIILATSDREIARIGAAAGAAICGQDADCGLNQAVAAALRQVTSNAVLVLPGDVPCVTAAEIAALLADHGTAPACSLVPARDEGGTNAMLMSPPGCIAPAYGPQSFRRHLQAARAAGLQPRIVRLAGLGLDVDTPADLLSLDRARIGRHSARVLASARPWALPLDPAGVRGPKTP